MMGDAVNLASRIEGVNKVFGTRILISESTYLQSKGQFLARELGRIVVKGRSHPVTVYELMATQEESQQRKLAISLKNNYEKGLQAFYNRDFVEAETVFSHLFQETEDSPAQFMQLQADLLNKKHPSSQWGGEIILLQK